MAARVALLLAFTSFFAVAWESDQKAEAKAIAAKAGRSDQTLFAQEATREIVISQVSRGIAISSESDFSQCLLPDGIRPGTYRVVDDRGSVGWTTIFPDRDLLDGPANADVEMKKVELFTSQSSAGRWYFIRVEAAPVMASPREEHSILR